ncbi:hypothetical protein CFR80_03075 [Komagataeibacter oboediens]|uniref:Uncharacterized protein n=1 Tax=Komagataeibacter oboediens TaxID=65958 RepID=A0A318QZZ3_9PROT|nr:hypothetical protein CFR80_03075 [Komagataeibacter oboediens]
MSFWAASESFHKSGSSARLFSSARRSIATSQSKMPPQQCHRLLDLVVQGLCLGRHGLAPRSTVNNAGTRAARHTGRQYRPPMPMSPPEGWDGAAPDGAAG